MQLLRFWGTSGTGVVGAPIPGIGKGVVLDARRANTALNAPISHAFLSSVLGAFRIFRIKSERVAIPFLAVEPCKLLETRSSSHDASGSKLG